MKRSNDSYLVVLATVLAAVIGIALRCYQLTACMTEEGFIRQGNPILYVLLGFAVLAIALLGLLCSGLNPTLGTERCYVAGAGFLFADLLGGVAVFHGSLLRLLAGESTPLFLCGMVAALLMAIAALLLDRQPKAGFWLLALASVFFAALLIYDFKHWSTDPLVIDFCFRLLALVFGMLSLFHVSGFALHVGRRRLSVFWAAGSVVFAATLLPDFFLKKAVSLGELLLLTGLTLYGASHGLRLLRRTVQQDRTPPEQLEREAASGAFEPSEEEL